MRPIRVLLVDDQPLIRMGFRMVLEDADGITVVGEAGDGAEAAVKASALSPEVTSATFECQRSTGWRPHERSWPMISAREY